MDNLINIYNSKEIINTKLNHRRKKESETGEMDQQLRALAVLAEALVQVPALTLKAICTSSFGGSSALLWPLWAPALTWCTHIKITKIFVKAPRRHRE